MHSLHHSQILTISICLPSGDTDILVLTIVHLYNYKEKIHLDNGAGVNRNNIWLGVLQFKDKVLNALIGKDCLHFLEKANKDAGKFLSVIPNLKHFYQR